MTETPSGPSSYDYDLRIDEQVNKLLDLDHKLTFFIVTASVATLAFTLNFAFAHKLVPAASLPTTIWLAGAALTALAAAGIALLALHAGIRSFRLHVQYRYARKSFGNLTAVQQAEWETLNGRANQARRWSFVFLITTASLQVSYLTYALENLRSESVHHYGEDHTEVVASEAAFEVSFTNTETGQKITMHIPRAGVREQPDQGLTLDKVMQVARKVAHLLARELQ